VIRVVLDANTVASGFAGFGNPESTPGQIVRLWRAGEFELIVSEHLRTEVIHTFQQPYFRRRLSPAQSSRAAALLRYQATHIPIAVEVHGIATHPEDDMILATAVSAKAIYLVSGDERLQRLRTYEEVTILSPREFLDILIKSES
jgi:putative PIN family toxin of toxin-antitoxin system